VLVASAAYYQRFDLENLRNNVGEYEFGLSSSIPLKNNKRINLGLSIIGTRNFDPSLKLTVGFKF